MLIVALGNPGVEYKNNRHNAGFLFADWLAGDMDWKTDVDHEVLSKKITVTSHMDKINLEIIKPQTYMNESGRAVSKYINYYKIGLDQVVVIFDDMDLELGNWKIQKDKGPKIHNGLNSIEKILGLHSFLRIRIGIFNQMTRYVNADTTIKIPGAEYVLQDFTNEEKNILENKVFVGIKNSLSLI